MIYFLIINVINNLPTVYYLGNKFAFFSNKKVCFFLHWSSGDLDDAIS